MTDVLIIILSTVFVLSVVVTIHELGHYWAARACGVAIDCFSLGFGPPLVSWRDKHVAHNVRVGRNCVLAA